MLAMHRSSSLALRGASSARIATAVAVARPVASCAFRTVAIASAARTHQHAPHCPASFAAVAPRRLFSSQHHDAFAAGGGGGHAESAGWTPAEAQIPLSLIDPSTEQPPLAKHKQHGYVLYVSPFETVVKALKMVSLTSAMLSIAGAPVLVMFGDSTNGMPLAGRIAMAGTVLVFGLGTTAFLSAFMKSYVMRIFARKDEATPANGALEPGLTEDERAERQWTITIQTSSLFGQPVYTPARHLDFHPLFSRMFNNVRVETALTGKLVARDLFVHLDMASHPMLLPLWHRATVVASKPSAIALATTDGAELAALEARAGEKDQALTREQALKDIAAIHAQIAAEKKAAEAAATKQ